MKKILLTVVVIVAILLVAPFIVGLQAQSKLTEGLPQMSASGEQYIKVEVTDYNRGWFSSTAAVEVNFTKTYLDSLSSALDEASNGTDPAAANPVIDLLSKGIKQDLSIGHGPILTGDGISLGLARVISTYGQGDTDTEKELRETLNIDYLIRSQYDLGFSGAGDLFFDIPSFQIAEEGFQTASFSGLIAEGSLDLDQLDVSLNGSMPSLIVSRQGVNMDLAGTQFDINSRMIEGLNFGIGGGSFTIEQFNITNPDTNVALNNLLVKTDSQLNDAGHIDIQLSYEIGEVITADSNLTDLILAMEMENFDAQAIQQLQEIALQTNNNEDPAALLQEMSGIAHQMLSTGPSLTLKPVGFKLNDQSFNLNLEVTTNVDQLPAADAFSFDNPMLFMALFSLKGDATVNRELLTTMMIPQLKSQLAAGVPEDAAVTDEQLQQMAEAQAPMLLGTLEGQGFIKADPANDANYVVDMEFNNGALLINGNPIPLGALQGP